jgi:predicted PurR-regulated permease PerM
MSAQSTSGQGTKTLLVMASLVVIIAGLKAGAPVILPVVLAFFLSVLSFPLLHWLMRHSVRLPFALLLTVLAVAALLTAFGFLISSTVGDFALAAPAYVEQLVDKARGFIETLEARDIEITDWLVLEPLDPGFMVDRIGGILSGTVLGITSAVSSVTLVLIIMICMLAEGAGLPKKLQRAFGKGDTAIRYFTSITEEVQRYLEVKTLVSLMTGLVLWGWAALLDVPFPLLWGLIAFVFNYIPVIGSILAAVLPVLVTLVQFGIGRAALLALGYLAVNFLVGNLLEPIWMGRKFGLSTLVVFLSLVFWGWLWGLVGMLLSVPLTMVIKIMLEHSPKMRWLAVLLEPGPGTAAVRPARESA